MKASNKPIVAVDPGVSGGFAVNTPDGIILLSMPESLPEICALINRVRIRSSQSSSKSVAGSSRTRRESIVQRSFGMEAKAQGKGAGIVSSSRRNPEELRRAADPSLCIGWRKVALKNL